MIKFEVLERTSCIRQINKIRTAQSLIPVRKTFFATRASNMPANPGKVSVRTTCHTINTNLSWL